MINHSDETFLRLTLDRVATIPSKEWERLRAIIHYKELAPGDYFVRAGESANDIGFILSGLLRKFYETQEGREYTKDFSPEHSLVSAYSALLQNKSSHFNIQAIEPTRLLVIPYFKFTQFYAHHTCWQELGRKIAEKLFIDREQREWELALISAKGRYDLFMRQYPGLIARLPQYHVASYLGISPVSLSRLIGKKQSQRQKPKR